MACSYPPSDRKHYFKCMKCPFVANCPEIEKSREILANEFETFRKMHNKDLDGMLKYYFDEHGWHSDGKYDKVKKNRYLTMPPKAYCYAGNATHPKFFKCKGCEQFRNCQLGYYKLEREKEEKRRQAEEFERQIEPIKRVFRKVADVVEGIFRRNNN